MELSISRQTAALLCFFAAGIALGLIYDILRPIRHGLRHDWLWDSIFCFIAAAVIFCFSMGAGSGRLGTWDIASAAVGFCLYIDLMSRYILPLFERLFRIFQTICKKLYYEIK